MRDSENQGQQLGEQGAARREFLGRIGKTSLGIPATVMLMSVTEKKASATGHSISGGVGSDEWNRYWSQIDP